MSKGVVLSKESALKVKSLIQQMNDGGFMSAGIGPGVFTMNDMAIVKCTGDTGAIRDCLVGLYDAQTPGITYLTDSDAKLTTLDGNTTTLEEDEVYFAYRSGNTTGGLPLFVAVAKPLEDIPPCDECLEVVVGVSCVDNEIVTTTKYIRGCFTVSDTPC